MTDLVTLPAITSPTTFFPKPRRGEPRGQSPGQSARHPNCTRPGRSATLKPVGATTMAKSKSNKDAAGNRKLAADHGRKKRKSGGEPQKKRTVPRGAGRRAGSSKEHD